MRSIVRGLMIVVSVVGVWLGWVVRCAHIQRDAVATIQKGGGTVSYDWEWANGKYVAESCRA